MNDFKQIAEICGVPIIYSRSAEGIRSSAIRLVILTGAIDDTTIGEPGLYHWFEHVPFRSTKNFPGGRGKKNLKIAVEDAGGHIGASTGYHSTEYYASIPTRHLELAIKAVTDLVASPLMRPEDIEAEREIIKEEISQFQGRPHSVLAWKVINDIWHDHPLRFPIAGTAASLDQITPELLLKAREVGYGTSRMSFLISTSVPEDKVVAMLSSRFKDLPQSKAVSPRKTKASVKPMTWKPGVEIVGSTTLKSSVVELMFPTSGGVLTPEKMILDWFIRTMFTHGADESPLLHEIRHKKSLAYSGKTMDFHSPDGGFFGFYVETQHPKRVLEILRTKVLGDKRLRSSRWLESVRKSLHNNRDMRISYPSGDINLICDYLSETGELITEDAMYNLLDELRFESIQEELDKMRSLETARTFIFEGGK